MAHTIVLVQSGSRVETRTYWDFESLSEAIEYICRIYEMQLKENQPDCNTITYDIAQLFEFLDRIPDIGILVYQRATNMYAPFPREWIKRKIFIFLKREAARNQRLANSNNDNNNNNRLRPINGRN